MNALGVVNSHTGYIPIMGMAYRVLGDEYAVYFPAGSPRPSDQEVINVANTVLRSVGLCGPSVGGRKKRRTRRTRRKY